MKQLDHAGNPAQSKLGIQRQKRTKKASVEQAETQLFTHNIALPERAPWSGGALRASFFFPGLNPHATRTGGTGGTLVPPPQPVCRG